MDQFLDKISDTAKFIIMLLIYTGYMTWWASGLTHDVVENTKNINNHAITDTVVNNQTIALTENIRSIQLQQGINNATLKDFAVTHARCALLMEQLMNRMNRLEGYDGSSK